jgi:hypothetical protein
MVAAPQIGASALRGALANLALNPGMPHQYDAAAAERVAEMPGSGGVQVFGYPHGAYVAAIDAAVDGRLPFWGFLFVCLFID